MYLHRYSIYIIASIHNRIATAFNIRMVQRPEHNKDGVFPIINKLLSDLVINHLVPYLFPTKKP